MIRHIEVLSSDFEFIRDVLFTAHNHSIVLDLAENYRKLNNRQSGNQSKLTAALEEAVAKAEAYLQEEVEDDVESPTVE